MTFYHQQSHTLLLDYKINHKYYLLLSKLKTNPSIILGFNNELSALTLGTSGSGVHSFINSCFSFLN